MAGPGQGKNGEKIMIGWSKERMARKFWWGRGEEMVVGPGRERKDGETRKEMLARKRLRGKDGEERRTSL